MNHVRPTLFLACLLLLQLIPSGDSEASSNHSVSTAGGCTPQRIRKPPDPKKLRLSLRIAEAKRDAKKSRLYRSLSRRQRSGLIARP